MLRHRKEPEPWIAPQMLAGETNRPRIQDEVRQEFGKEAQDKR
jgi:hypothetical protein